MIRNKLLCISSVSLTMLVSPVFARDEDNFGPVGQNVQERTGSVVVWEREQNARNQTLAEVRRLLKNALGANTAAQIALLNNRGLQATFEEIGLAEADLIEARTIPNPDLNFQARIPDKSPSGTDIEYSIAQDFLTILMIPLRTKVAKDQLAAAQLRVSDEVTRLVEETTVAFYQLQAAQEILERLKTEQEAQSTSLDLIQRLHEAGNITDLQLLQQQSEYSQARLNIAQVEADIRELREKLNQLMGLWGGDTSWTIRSGVPDVPNNDLDIQGLETLAVTQRYDLAASKAELEGMIKALGLEKTFRWIGALDFGMDSERQSDSQTITGPTLRIQLPIFNQGQARIARSQSQLRRSYARFEQLAVSTRSEVRQLRDKMISDHDFAQFYRTGLIPERKQVRDQMQLQYNAMIVSPLDLFTARRQEIEAERGYIDAKRDYWVARAELERAVGGNLSAKARTRQVSLKNPANKSK
jgi:outer membrane protein, heavy metal efflux system